MVRWPKYACLLITSVLLEAGTSSAGGGLILQGRVTDVRGKAVPGAELQVVDSSGKLRYRALSDIRGIYRFPTLPEMGANPLPYRLTISHLRYKPVAIDDFLAGARVSSPAPQDLAPGQPIALVAAMRVASRDFSLTPSVGTPQNPAAGPVDPNLYEYYYQQALLLLDQNKKKEAVAYLKLYAQAGSNLMQVVRSLELIAQNDTN